MGLSWQHTTLPADTTTPLALYESGFAPRWYVPRTDVNQAALTPATTQTFCPYKGVCSYYDIGDARHAAWSRSPSTASPCTQNPAKASSPTASTATSPSTKHPPAATHDHRKQPRSVAREGRYVRRERASHYRRRARAPFSYAPPREGELGKGISRRRGKRQTDGHPRARHCHDGNPGRGREVRDAR